MNSHIKRRTCILWKTNFIKPILESFCYHTASKFIVELRKIENTEELRSMRLSECLDRMLTQITEQLSLSQSRHRAFALAHISNWTEAPTLVYWEQNNGTKFCHPLAIFYTKIVKFLSKERGSVILCQLCVIVSIYTACFKMSRTPMHM
jgi:hypothetical protein